MTTTDWHGGPMSLDDIRSDLENDALTPTQRKAAFEHLRRWLRERPTTPPQPSSGAGTRRSSAARTPTSEASARRAARAWRRSPRRNGR
jgi:hypothetical protein